MKNFFKGLFAIIALVLMTYIGSKSFGIIGAIVAFVCTILIIISIKRADFMYSIGFFQYCKGNVNVAFGMMQSAYKTTKLSPHKTISYSYYLIREGRIDEAETILNKVTYLKKRELSPADLMNAKINRSLVLWKQDKLDEAIELLEECHKENLVSTTLYGTLGYFYILNNQLPKALEYNKQAFEYNSDNAVIADNLAYNYILFGEFEKAEEIYKKILVAKPQFIEPYYN
jgi:tetratricopeptide (TPR) repeat protein